MTYDEANRILDRNDLKKSFRRLAFKYHPDRRCGNATKFKQVVEAFEILSGKRRPRVRIRAAGWTTVWVYGTSYTVRRKDNSTNTSSWTIHQR